MNHQGTYNPFQLINVFYEFRSVILTTNKDFCKLGDFLREDNFAVSIADRIIHHSHKFMLGGERYCLKQKLAN
jgi:DNA replication protein DnaC